MAKKKKELTDDRLKIGNFHKRWNIELSDKERWEDFKSRALNAYSETVGLEILQKDKVEDEFHKLIGIHIKRVKGSFDVDFFYDNALIKSPTYNYLLEQNDIKKFILAIEAIFWLEKLDWKYKLYFLEEIRNAIIITAVPLVVAEKGIDILFYPAGAGLLDEKLINDNLDWLGDCPQAYEIFKAALFDLGIKNKERQVIDNLRLSLELLFKAVLKNNKSLENQKNEIGKYLKDKDTSIEINNLFWQVLDYYSKYQNDKVKHSNNAKADEVEFILYLTGTLMRFILTK